MTSTMSAQKRKTVRDIEKLANIQDGIEHIEATGHKISDAEELTFSSIARALANRYDSIYYVNINTNRYVEYISSSEYQDLKVETSGEDFWVDGRRNILRVVHEDDKELALAIHRKEYLLKELEKEPVLAVTYRLMFDGKPHYYHGRFTKGGIDDEDHLIIGWANVDSQIQREEEFERAKKENERIASINSALTSDFVKVYYVDPDDETYILYTLKIVYSDDKKHFLVGIRNINMKMQREKEYESRLHSMSALVNTDALTGVKNRNAFAQEELALDKMISKGNVQFAMVICDVNDLKTISDSLGHKAGDKLIKDTALAICDIFKRSPVFRIGGDEFVVVLWGKDYEHRRELMSALKKLSRKNQQEGGIVFASGIAEFDPDTDQNCEVVFERADARMYEHKKELK